MDYVQRTVTVLESDGVAQLTVNISMPSGGVPNEMSFGLLVNTSDETAIGLEFTVDFMYLYSLLVSIVMDGILILTGRYTTGSC